MRSPGPATHGSYASPRFVTWRDAEGKQQASLAFGTTPEMTAASALHWKRGYKELRYALAAARRGEAEAGPVMRAWCTRFLRPEGRLSAGTNYRWAETWREAANRTAKDTDDKWAITMECDPIEALGALDAPDLEFHLRCLFGARSALRKWRCPPPWGGMAKASPRELLRFRREAAREIRLAMLLPDYTMPRVRHSRSAIYAQEDRKELVQRHGATIGTTLVNQCINEGLRPLVTVFTPTQDAALRKVAALYGYEPVEKLSQLQLAAIWTLGKDAGKSWVMRRAVLSGQL